MGRGRIDIPPLGELGLLPPPPPLYFGTPQHVGYGGYGGLYAPKLYFLYLLFYSWVVTVVIVVFLVIPNIVVQIVD